MYQEPCWALSFRDSGLYHEGAQNEDSKSPGAAGSSPELRETPSPCSLSTWMTMELVRLGAGEELSEADSVALSRSPVLGRRWSPSHSTPASRQKGFPGKTAVSNKCPNEQQGQEAAPIPGWVF